MSLSEINKAIDLLNEGKGLRTVIQMAGWRRQGIKSFHQFDILVNQTIT